ncbi:MAG: radical SAM protein [candidate division WOR-3 bacterium]|nr:radical SAM protein [candidate division WOR-3 bacterium]
MVKLTNLYAKAFKGILHTATYSSTIRKLALKKAVNELYKKLTVEESDIYPLKEQLDKFYMGRALLHSIERAISNDVSPQCRKALINIVIGKMLTGGDTETKEKFNSEFGFDPPTFVTISPTKTCNLRCKGCYASSGKSTEKLDFSTFDRIIHETKELWGSHFTVISGGEPLLYKGLLDTVEKHKDTFFLMYTNGTLIDRDIAERFAELGNITPAISVEGFEKETDARRGKGVYKRIGKAMDNLKNTGVPFGLSITATKQNVDIITSNEFYDFYFEKEPRAIYGWIFHYMPTPQQRLHMWMKNRSIVKERKLFLADFWNDGVVTDGCISAGRTGGYFYINWNGDCAPCVFAPYTQHNINNVYENGGNLNTVLNSEFFKAIRKWQDEYAYEQPKEKKGNLLRPCAIRDHYGMYHKLLEHHCPRPINEDAQDALNDEEYHKKLTVYGEKIEELTKEIWEKEYLQSGR